MSTANINLEIILNKTDLISNTELKLRIDEIKKRFNELEFINCYGSLNENVCWDSK